MKHLPIYMLIAFAATAPLAAVQNEAEPMIQPLPAPGACFEFTEVTTFKTVDADTIRVETANATAYNIDLAGPQCLGLEATKDLVIQSVPSFPICIGPQTGRHKLSFGAQSDPAPRQCFITAISAAETLVPNN
jgi:hypothetical protein